MTAALPGRGKEGEGEVASGEGQVRSPQMPGHQLPSRGIAEGQTCGSRLGAVGLWGQEEPAGSV